MNLQEKEVKISENYPLSPLLIFPLHFAETMAAYTFYSISLNYWESSHWK